MEESLEDTIVLRRLRWFGRLARMDDHRLSKKILFGWLPKHRPAHETKIQVKRDLKKFGIDRGWFRAETGLESNKENT